MTVLLTSGCATTCASAAIVVAAPAPASAAAATATSVTVLRVKVGVTMRASVIEKYGMLRHLFLHALMTGLPVVIYAFRPALTLWFACWTFVPALRFAGVSEQLPATAASVANDDASACCSMRLGRMPVIFFLNPAAGRLVGPRVRSGGRGRWENTRSARMRV